MLLLLLADQNQASDADWRRLGPSWSTLLDKPLFQKHLYSTTSIQAIERIKSCYKKQDSQRFYKVAQVFKTIVYRFL